MLPTLLPAWPRTRTWTWPSQGLDNPLHLPAVLLLVSCLVHPSRASVLPHAPVAEPRHHKHKHHAADFSADFATAIGVVAAVVLAGTTLVCVSAHCWRQILDWGCSRRRGRGRSRERGDKGEGRWSKIREMRGDKDDDDDDDGDEEEEEEEEEEKYRRRYHHKEVWFCGADRGLPMPRFDFFAEPESDIETDPLARPLPVQVLESGALVTPRPLPVFNDGGGEGGDEDDDIDYYYYHHHHGGSGGGGGIVHGVDAVVSASRMMGPGTLCWDTIPSITSTTTTTTTTLPPTWLDAGDEIERPATVAYFLDRP